MVDRPADADPFALFQAWLAEAETTEPNDPNAMTVATATPDGIPAARILLLKELDPPGANPRGFVFYTNRQSRKSNELAANPRAALLFHWKTLRRQIRIEGVVIDATAAESDAYFATRLRISRLGAWASDQSRPLAERAVLERRLAEQEARFPGEPIPRPPYWGGYRLIPARFEFWQDMPYRLHDRTVFTRAGSAGVGSTGAGDGWTMGKLFP